MDFMQLMSMSEGIRLPKNEDFYSHCTAYFEFLRERGETDNEFEDEYYFTMPAISNTSS